MSIGNQSDDFIDFDCVELVLHARLFVYPDHLLPFAFAQPFRRSKVGAGVNKLT